MVLTFLGCQIQTEPPKKRRSMQSGEEEGEATSGSEVDMESDADGGDGSESDEDGEMSSGGQKKVSPRKLIKSRTLHILLKSKSFKHMEMDVLLFEIPDMQLSLVFNQFP